MHPPPRIMRKNNSDIVEYMVHNDIGHPNYAQTHAAKASNGRT